MNTPACLPAAQGTVAAFGRRVWAELETQQRTGLRAASATCATYAWSNRLPRSQERFRAHGSSLTGVLRRGRVLSRVFFHHICSSPHTSVNTNGHFLLSFSVWPAAEQRPPVLGEVSERTGLCSYRNSARVTPWLWSRAAQGRSRPWGPHLTPCSTLTPVFADPGLRSRMECQAAQREPAGGHGDSSRVTRCRSCQCWPD